MTFLTINEINSNPIYAPFDDEEEKINFIVRIRGDKFLEHRRKMYLKQKQKKNVITEVLGLTEDDVDSLFEKPKMNIDLQNEIIDFKRKYRNSVKYNNWNNKQTMEIVEYNMYSSHGFTNNGDQYFYKTFNFVNIKKKNKNGKIDNTNYNYGYCKLLNKNDLLIWAMMNNIKVKKSLKYFDIVKILLKKL